MNGKDMAVEIGKAFSGKFVARLFFMLALLAAAFAIANFAIRGALESTLLLRAQPIVYADGWFVTAADGRVELPEASRAAANRVDVPLALKNALPDTLTSDMCLSFQTKNESVRVLVEDTLVYTYGKTPQRVYGHGVGAVWHIAPLPEDARGKLVTVELTPIGGRTGTAPYRFLLGGRSDIISYLLWNSATLIIVSILLACIGLGASLLFIVWLVRRDGRAVSTFYFALFVLLATVWMASDSGLLQFLLPNKGVIYLLFGCSFYLFCTPFALFMATMQPAFRRMYTSFSVVNSCYALVRILLYVLGALDFETALWALHLLMGVMILATNLALWLPVLRTRSFGQPELTIAITVFTLSESASLVNFYAKDKLNVLRNGYSSGFYAGILLFVLITIAGVIRRAQLLRQQAFKAAFLERRAYTDELTGLLNVKGFDDKCAELLCNAPDGRRHAVVDFDVNFFSQYNATNGLPAGDEMLQGIARQLMQNCFPGELCARQEADHFVCMLHGNTFADILARIREADKQAHGDMAKRMLLLSYGVAEVTDRSLPIPALRNQAAVAKRTVKGNYETNVAIYDRSLHESQLQEVMWLSGFEQSLGNNEYVIYLQPKIDIRTERIGGAEALVRRVERDGSVIPAGPIIEALERKGFVTKLDYHVLELVCKLLRRCLDEKRAVCPISSNFSRVHLYDPDFPARVAEITDRYGIPRALVEIELTETAFLAGKDALQGTVRGLHAAGFPVAIDDFGSGYSSLNMLKDVEVDTIKLDREFLAGFAENGRADTVIAHTLHLAQEMRITAVAEGIETAEQLRFLRNLGCDFVQGYFYSRPLPEDAFIEKYMPLP